MEKQSHLKWCFDIGFSSANLTIYLKIVCQYFLKASWYPTLRKTLLTTRRYKIAIFKICSVLSNYQRLHLKHLRTARDDSYSPNHQIHSQPSYNSLSLTDLVYPSTRIFTWKWKGFFVHRQQFYFQLRSLKSLCHVYPIHEKVWISEVYHYLWTSWIYKAALEIITALW